MKIFLEVYHLKYIVEYSKKVILTRENNNH